MINELIDNEVMLVSVLLASLCILAWSVFSTLSTYRQYQYNAVLLSHAPVVQPTADNRELAKLFGETKSLTTRVRTTSLAWKLRGIFTADPAKAIIETVNGHEQLYQIGDEIEPGIRLQAIGADRVILDREGQQELLWLDPPPATVGGV
jgi:type II secretory pathway component PulC